MIIPFSSTSKLRYCGLPFCHGCDFGGVKCINLCLYPLDCGLRIRILRVPPLSAATAIRYVKKFKIFFIVSHNPLSFSLWVIL